MSARSDICQIHRIQIGKERIAPKQGLSKLRELTDIDISNPVYLGIVYCPQQTKSIGQIIQGIVLIWQLLTTVSLILVATKIRGNFFNFRFKL